MPLDDGKEKNEKRIYWDTRELTVKLGLYNTAFQMSADQGVMDFLIEDLFTFLEKEIKEYREADLQKAKEHVSRIQLGESFSTPGNGGYA